MSSLLYILIAILMLGAIIMCHEAGHFLVGRLTGIAVEEFSIGMGPAIFSRKGKKTMFSIRAIPLGGFCRFKGEDADDDSPDAMNNQPVWKRFLTVLAGPAMNAILANILCVVMLAGYIYYEYLPGVAGVQEGTPAEACGLQAGDRILSINGNTLSYDQDGCDMLQQTIQSADLENELSLTVDRNGETLSFSLTPQLVTDEETGESSYKIGIILGGRTYSLGEALSGGFTYMVEATKLMLTSLKDLFFHGEGLDQTMGPVGIISFVSEYVREGVYMGLYLAFIISLNLGLMNLLPLPALDGGRLVFLIIEGIRRKPVPRDKEGLVHAIGFVLLIGVIIFFTYKDILRLING